MVVCVVAVAQTMHRQTQIRPQASHSIHPHLLHLLPPDVVAHLQESHRTLLASTA